MSAHLHLTINVADQLEKDILIAQLFDLGFEGMEETDHEIHAYIKPENFNEFKVQELVKDSRHPFTTSIEPQKNWNEEWEKNFEPVIVDDFCTIRADFHKPAINSKHELVITPKMSFGTGHHATTYMMVQQMKDISFSNKAVADFGTGTGVLAILAEKLGSRSIWAIDHDEICITNAKENIERNNCSLIEVHKLDLFAATDNFDIILANINKNVIIDNLEKLALFLNPGGTLLLSGLLKQDEYDVLMACQLYNLSRIKTVEKDNWITILLEP